MSLERLEALASKHQLQNFGTLATTPEDDIGTGTLMLLGPAEPGFWSHVTAEPEFDDNAPDPLDRWSRRSITDIARQVGGRAYFPFGLPHRPFVAWALRSGHAWQSPVMLLVHDVAGLMVSYRGAVLLPDLEHSPSEAQKPCDFCRDKPCLTACPARALTAQGYDVDACHDYLDTAAGRSNLKRGCAVRRSCPISQHYARSEEQSAFHMKHFHPCR